MQKLIVMLFLITDPRAVCCTKTSISSKSGEILLSSSGIASFQLLAILCKTAVSVMIITVVDSYM